MDPPPYGHGPDNEKWTLQEKLNELILLDKNSFFILSMYAVGLSPMVGLNIEQKHFKIKEPEWGEFFLKSPQGRDLPMGTSLRFTQ